MRFIITKDHEEVSNVMAQLMLKHMHSDKERVNISITTGKTPVRGYQILAEQTKGKAYFNNVHYYIFDEIPGIRMIQKVSAVPAWTTNTLILRM